MFCGKYAPLSSSDHAPLGPEGFLCIEGPASSANLVNDKGSSIGFASKVSGNAGVARGVTERGVDVAVVEAAPLRGFRTRFGFGSSIWRGLKSVVSKKGHRETCVPFPLHHLPALPLLLHER